MDVSLSFKPSSIRIPHNLGIKRDASFPAVFVSGVLAMPVTMVFAHAAMGCLLWTGDTQAKLEMPLLIRYATVYFKCHGMS